MQIQALPFVFCLFLLFIPALSTVQVNYDFNLAVGLVRASFATYCGDLVNAHFNCYWCSQAFGGSENVSWIGNFGQVQATMFGFVAVLESVPAVLVIYRGTEDVAGWIADADFIQESFPYCAGCQVHSGFWDAYLSDVDQVLALWEAAMDQCSELAGKQCQTYISGHSLGAALATVAAFDMAVRNSSCTFNLWNFGSPRVGNAAFSSALVSKLRTPTYRFTHSHDLVPLVPPRSDNYFHIVEEIWQDPNGNYHSCSTSNGEDPSCCDSTTVPNPLDHATYMGQDCLSGILHQCFYDEP